MDNALIASAIIAVILAPVMQAVKGLESINNKYIPFISWTVGVLIGVGFAFAFNFDIALYALAGLLAGLGSNGIYDGTMTIKGAVNKNE